MNETIKIKCNRLDEEYKGVFVYAKAEHALRNLLPLEEAEVMVDQRRGKTLFQVKKILKKSQDRIVSACPYFEKCGGCQLQHISYDKQIKLKTEYIKTLMNRYDTEVNECLKMEDPLRYRYKNQMTFSKDGKNTVAGFYEEHSHRVIDIQKCIIQEENVEKIVRTLKSVMTKYKIQPYNEDKKLGLIRHVLVKTSSFNKEVMVVIVVSKREFEGKSVIVKELRKKHPEISTIVFNVNARSTSIILGEEERVAFGKGFIVDKLGDLTFKISSKSFYQVNPKQTINLYQKAIEYANLTKDDFVIDAYCGTGTIGLFASQHCKEVIGIELNKDAVMDANKNAQANKVNNIKFIQNDATKWIENYKKTSKKVDVVFMDPPRAGSTPAFLNSVLALGPSRIVYVSCEPKTLARDLMILTKKYRIKKIQPVDMFPFTKHVETVVLLRRID